MFAGTCGDDSSHSSKPTTENDIAQGAGRQFRWQVLRGFDDALVRFTPDAARALDQVGELAALLTQALLDGFKFPLPILSA